MVTLARALAVGVAYFLLARLAALLAIPPGYTVSVWPAAGAAFLAGAYWGPRCLWGVVLGSAANNALLGAPVWAGALIGLGAAAQARAGVWWCDWLNGGWRVNEERLPAVLFWAGPFSCLVNATAGPFVLGVAGAIQWSSWPWQAWTWWLGDSLGVLFTVPIGFYLIAAIQRSART